MGEPWTALDGKRYVWVGEAWIGGLPRPRRKRVALEVELGVGRPWVGEYSVLGVVWLV